MGVLAPGLLLLGLAAAVPIVLHLLQRQPGPRRVFPALRYLRQAERESARRVRLRQLLLLALRVGAVLLLALAAARPFLPRGSGEHPPTAVALVLDNSLSSGLVTGDERVLDVLKARALATLERAGPEDRFWVVSAAEPSTPAAPLDAARAADRVRATEVVAAGADLAAALGRARGLLAAGAEGRATEIQLLSDLQATGLTEDVEGPGADGPPVLVWAPPGEAPPNAGVVAVEVGGGLAPRAGQRSSVAARVAGGDDSVTVRLLLSGQVRAAGHAPPGASILLPFPAHPEGTVTGAVEIDADALRGDDRRWFLARVAPPPAVALTGDAPFVADALEVLAASGRVRRAAPAEARVRLAPAGAGAEGLREGITVVVLPPASPLELPALNRRLAAGGIPWRYAPPEGGGASRIAPPADDEELARLLEPVRLELAYGLRREGARADSVLLAMAEGRPWLVAGERSGGGRYLLLASPLAPQGGTLVASAAMVPLVDRLVGTWAEAEEAVTLHTAGEPLPLPGRATAVIRPDGTRERVEGGAPWRGATHAGVYRVLAGDTELAAFAVNPPAEETPLARLDDDALEARLADWEVRSARDPGDWERMAYGVRRGGEAWWPLALLALVLLGAEMMLAAGGGAGPRRTKGTAEAAPAGAGGSWHTRS